MARRRAFDMCHPSVNLLYFLLVLVCSVGCMHPACLGISLGGALACGLLFRGRRAVGRLLGLLGPVALLAAGGLSYTYYPACQAAGGPGSLSLLTVYLALCLTPLALEAWEERQWKRTTKNTGR